jgi:hypothetical protein
MASIESRVTSAILERIRSRRDSPSEPAGEPSGPTSLVPAKVREAKLTDYQAITDLKQRYGLLPDPLENWKYLWEANPALKHMQTPRAIGWVVEAEGRVVGYLASISSLYHFQGKTLTAVVGSGFVAEPAYRAHTVRLMAAFYAQKPVDLYLSTTAVEATGKIACAFGCVPMPQPNYETVMFWVLRPYPFVQTVMKKLQVKPALATIGAAAASVAVGMNTVLRRRYPRGSARGLVVNEIKTTELGNEFEILWNEKLAESKGLLADRSLEFLRWHYNLPNDKAKTSVLCCRKDGKLTGYLTIRDEAGNSSGLRRSWVVDMIVKDDDPEMICALISAAYKHGKKARSHVLEVQGFPAHIRNLCAQWNPYSRTFPATPFFYKGANPELHRTLSDGALWYGTPFDGDTTLMPEM